MNQTPEKQGAGAVRSGRVIVLLYAALCLCGGGPLPIRAQPSAPEYEIKAVFLYNFAKYVSWPAASLPRDTQSPIVLCVIGKDPFGAALELAVQDRTAQGRPIAVRRIRNPEDAGSCHLLFISAAKDKRGAQIMAGARKTGLLTVGDTGRLAHPGGIISFLLEGDKVRFEIDLDAARQAGISISSQLLRLAKAVRDRTEP